MTVTADDFHHLFCDMFLMHVANRYDYYEMEEYRMACIGSTFSICAKLWYMLQETHDIEGKGAKPKHLLWSLAFLKVYATQFVLCSLLGTDRKTLMEWVWFIVERMHLLHGDVVSISLYYYYSCQYN
jgi:hypothetical protein